MHEARLCGIIKLSFPSEIAKRSFLLESSTEECCPLTTFASVFWQERFIGSLRYVYFGCAIARCVDKASDYLSQENLSPAAIGARHTGFSWLCFLQKKSLMELL